MMCMKISTNSMLLDIASQNHGPTEGHINEIRSITKLTVLNDKFYLDKQIVAGFSKEKTLLVGERLCRIIFMLFDGTVIKCIDV